jgi:flagellar FliL protein
MNMSDVAEITEGEGKDPPKKSKTKLLMIIGLAVLLAGGGGGFYFWKSKQSHAAVAAAQAAKKKVEVKAPLQFLSLDPAFVVNFEAEQAVRFLQIDVQVASRDTDTLEQLKHNEPVIRNDLLMLFGNQDYGAIASRDGKEKLRQQTLAVVRRVLQSEGGSGAKVENVYFTSFVMQ